MSGLKIILWTGGDAPNREAGLSVIQHYSDTFSAYWMPGYCGCPDCHPIVGQGVSKASAIANYWEQWDEKYSEGIDPQ
jgi:hypothetical protein